MDKIELKEILTDLELTEDKLEKIPNYIWEKFLEDQYGKEHVDTNYYMIGEDAKNGFLEVKFFIKGLNQTFADISKEEYLSLINYI